MYFFKSICTRRVIQILVLAFAVSACGAPTTTTTIPTRLPTCVPPLSTPEGNPYRAPILTTASVIYQYALTPEPVTNIPPYKKGQYEALQTLTKLVEHWSAYNNIPLENGQVIRITLTYISPELIQAIILNQMLYLNMSEADFEARVKEKMDRVANREEMLFLMTITYSNYDPMAFGDNLMTINIPLAEMVLIDSADNVTRPYHDDHKLDQEIPISYGPIAGYVAYPISVARSNGCNLILDPQWNTSTTISIPRLTVAGENYNHQLTWSIDYQPLISISPFPGPPSFSDIPPSFSSDRLSPASLPPNPARIPTAPENEYWNNYWIDMARYIWGQVVHDGIP